MTNARKARGKSQRTGTASATALSANRQRSRALQLATHITTDGCRAAATTVRTQETARQLFAERVDSRSELDDLDRALRPVVLPTDEHIAILVSVAVIEEVAALVLKLDANALPHVAGLVHAPFRLAVGEANADALHHIAQVEGDDAKQKDDALLVDRGVLEPRKFRNGPYRVPVAGAVHACGRVPDSESVASARS
jgi:hypothetical protein